MRTEVSYMGGVEVKYGVKGSKRLDVVIYADDGKTITAIYDLKPQGGLLKPGRIAEIRKNLPEGMKDVPIKEIFYPPKK